MRKGGCSWPAPPESVFGSTNKKSPSVSHGRAKASACLSSERGPRPQSDRSGSCASPA